MDKIALFARFASCSSLLVSRPWRLVALCIVVGCAGCAASGDVVPSQRGGPHATDAKQAGASCQVEEAQLELFRERGYISLPIQNEKAQRLNDAKFWLEKGRFILGDPSEYTRLGAMWEAVRLFNGRPKLHNEIVKWRNPQWSFLDQAPSLAEALWLSQHFLDYQALNEALQAYDHEVACVSKMLYEARIGKAAPGFRYHTGKANFQMPGRFNYPHVDNYPGNVGPGEPPYVFSVVNVVHGAPQTGFQIPKGVKDDAVPGLVDRVAANLEGIYTAAYLGHLRISPMEQERYAYFEERFDPRLGWRESLPAMPFYFMADMPHITPATEKQRMALVGFFVDEGASAPASPCHR